MLPDRQIAALNRSKTPRIAREAVSLTAHRSAPVTAAPTKQFPSGLTLRRRYLPYDSTPFSVGFLLFKKD